MSVVSDIKLQLLSQARAHPLDVIMFHSRMLKQWITEHNEKEREELYIFLNSKLFRFFSQAIISSKIICVSLITFLKVLPEGAWFPF